LEAVALSPRLFIRFFKDEMSAKSTSTRTKPVKTVLIIVMGLTLVALITDWQVWIKIALILGIAGLVSDTLANRIVFLWMKLSLMLSLIIPNILLSVVFFIFLTPLAWLFRHGNKDTLSLRNTKSSLFKESHKLFDKTSFEKPW
jgi:hypothetical protein